MFQIIDDTAGFERLRTEWNSLLHESTADCLFLTWEWLFTWWKHLAAERELFILTVRSAGQLLAIAPFARVAGERPLTTFEFLGVGSVGSHYLDIIVRRGSEPAALQALSAYLADYGGVVHLAQLEKRTSAAAELARMMQLEGWKQVRRNTGVCPYVSLSGHSWESYLASLRPEPRDRFNRRLAQAQSNFEIRFERARTGEECRDALNILIELHNLRWQGHGGSDAFQSTDVVLFHDELSRLALQQDWLRLYTLRFSNQPVAAIYGFMYQGVFYFYQSGYDHNFRKFSVARLAMGLAIKSAIEEGVVEYDMLHGNATQKSAWGKDVRHLERLELYPADVRRRTMKQQEVADRGIRRGGGRLLPVAMALTA